MKKSILFILSTLLCGAVSAQNIESAALGAAIVEHNFEYRNDSVALDIVFDLNALELDSKESVVYRPVISAGERTSSLPTLVVRGRNGAKSYRRAMIIGSYRDVEMYDDLYQTPYKVVDYYGKAQEESVSEGRVEYSYTLPYEMWMVRSQFNVASVVYSCCSSEDGGFVPVADNGLKINIPHYEPYMFTPYLALIKPEKVAIKRRDITYSSHIIFPLNSSYIDRELANNKSELTSIDDMMQSVISDDDCTITAVNITGYASPEGSYAANQLLSRQRATAIERLLVGRYDVAQSLYDVKFGGENWDDLIPMVEGSMLENRDEIVDVIESVSVESGREAQLMNMRNGVSYQYMLINFFPLLRKADISVEFNIDAYDLERIKEVIKTKPQNLSLEEMYRLSEGYDVESEEFLNIFLTAVSVFPDDEVALHNAMVSELRTGDVEAAAPFAEKLRGYDLHSAESANALGVYCTLTGDYAAAEEYLRTAEQMGEAGAASNMEQMEKRRERDELIERSEELRRKVYGDSDTMR